MIINNNIPALNTYRQLGINQNSVQKSMEKLSSGLRINKAGDDAAGLAISEKMRGQIRGLDQASRNASDGISMIQTAEGALNETHSILQRMRELSVQSANDTNVAVDREELQKEVDQLAQEITRISNNTEFNQQTLVNGGIKDTKFQIGANSDQNISLGIKAMDAQSLGVARDTTETTATIGATANINAVELADTVGSEVVDTATISFNQETIAATSGEIVGTAAATEADYRGLTLTYKVDGGAEQTVTFTAGATTLSAAVTELNNATGISATLNGDGELVLSSGSTGSASSIEITGGDSLSNLNIALGTGTGQESYEGITVTAGTTSKTFEIGDTTATTFSTGSDSEFGGISIDMGTGTLADLTTATDVLTISSETVAATEATFNADGTLNQQAVAAAGIDISTQASANAAIETINNAIELVSAERSNLGATQNRLEHTIANLDNSSENLSAAESRIRDVDMAKEMMEMTRANILSQASQSMLAQAQQQPQSVLQLLQ
jgi:flagellin